jgi:predicted permease
MRRVGERQWLRMFGGVAVALILLALVNQFANFIGRDAVPNNSDAIALLDEHDHPHFGVAMIVGLIIVALVSFGLFWLLGRRKDVNSSA